MLTHCLAFVLSALPAPTVKKRPITFNETRKELTYAYRKERYGDLQKSMEIDPRLIVIHWTAIASLERSFAVFKPEQLAAHRGELNSSALNVSAHFLVDRDGTIYQLMPDNWMARHVMGLNHVAIGIENVGGVGGKEDLTQKQVEANANLVRHLQRKYPKIDRVIGHYEYQELKQEPYFKELAANSLSVKIDPGPKFMKSLRQRLQRHP